LSIIDENLILENSKVLLRPLGRDDFVGLKKIAYNEEIWKYYTFKISNDNDLKDWIDKTINENKNGIRMQFVIIDKTADKTAGSTSYMNISAEDKRLEIGTTWLGSEFHGTGLNRQCKFLLLDYAFENLGMLRVEFKTDFLNQKSRKALVKIGAFEEGVLRSHMQLHDGRRRDSIYYSILNNEWDYVKNNFFKDILWKK
jgi:RimJ/RimL family protein N-acetyltransferase